MVPPLPASAAGLVNGFGGEVVVAGPADGRCLSAGWAERGLKVPAGRTKQGIVSDTKEGTYSDIPSG